MLKESIFMEILDFENSKSKNVDFKNSKSKNADFENSKSKNADFENSKSKNAGFKNLKSKNADFEFPKEKNNHYYGYIRLRPDESTDSLNSYITQLEKLGVPRQNITTEFANYDDRLLLLEGLIKNKLKEGSTLFVPEFRQISKSIQSFFKLQNLMYQKGINLIILDLMDKIDKTTNFGFAEQLQQSLAILGKLEAEQRKRRQSRAMKSAKTLGKNVGRPKINSDKLLKVSFLYYREGRTVKEISNITGLSKSTIYNILKSGSEFEKPAE